MSDNEKTASDKENTITPIWGVAANVRKEIQHGPGGKEVRIGTRKFHGGAKVYLYDVFWGMGGLDCSVVGRYRGRHGYITTSLKTVFLTNWHAELIYSPT